MIHFLISLFAFIFAIAILVIFHEFGHFWTARRLDVKILRFSVGFGKPLWRHQGKDGVEYVIAALPLGGYVKMLDEREGPVSAPLLPYAFNRKPLWARFAIVVAGPLFNFIFAIFAYWLMFMIGITGLVPRIGEVAPTSIAANAGLKPDEIITAIDQIPTHTWQQVYKQLMPRVGDQDTLQVEAKAPDGTSHSYVLQLNQWQPKGSKPNLLHALGIEPYHPPIPAVIDEVVSGEPAALAGILPHDEIVAVNGQPIQFWNDVTKMIIPNSNHPIQITVKRQDSLQTLSVTPRLKETETGEKVGFIGLVVKIPKMPADQLVKERLNPLAAFAQACIKTKEYTLITFGMLGKLLVGKVGLQSISGPITIAQGAGATAIVGLPYYLGFLALISISLGVINLLPIPILDGGHLLYFVIEGILRRPLSERMQIFGFKIGMLFLIFLIVVAFYNDLIRLF